MSSQIRSTVIAVTAVDDSIDPNDGVTSLQEAFIIAVDSTSLKRT